MCTGQPQEGRDEGPETDGKESTPAALYRSADGTVVEAERLPGGLVRFWELGGNYQLTISAKSFDSSFKPHVPSGGLKARAVYGSWLPENLLLPAYCDDTRWNGWVNPRFTKETGLLLTSFMDGQLVYDAEADVFVDLPDGYGEPIIYGSELLNVDGNEIHVYPIGAGSWCWGLATSQTHSMG